MTTLSVIIPTLNEAETLPMCLATLMPQLSGEDEILVIDAGSADDTVELAESFGCKVFCYPSSLRGEARDFGSKLAEKDVILNTDSDIYWPEGFIEKLRGHYDSYPVAGVAGGWKDGKGRILGEITNKILEGVFQYADCICSYRRDIYEHTNGHPHVNYGEQVALWLEIRSKYPTLYDPSMYVYHLSEAQTRIPSYLIGAGFLASGAAYEHLIGGDVGYGLMGAGAGFLLGQIGSEIIQNPDPNHIHHYQIGLLVAGLGAALYGFGYNKDLSAGLLGLGSGLFVHDLICESLLPVGA